MREATAPQQFTPLELKTLLDHMHATPEKGRSDAAQWVAERGGSFLPLELETRPTVDTAAAGWYLRKAQQTLRIWACKENGPIRPIRVGAHLHWKTADIRKLLGVA